MRNPVTELMKGCLMMICKFVAGVITVCFLLTLPMSSQGAEGVETLLKEKPEGRDAPIWDKGPDYQAPTFPAIKKISKGIFSLGNITVNKLEGFVSLNGEVNMDEGLVEYLACGPSGKLHESVLKLDVNPYYLQIALLLIGLEPGNKSLEFQGAPGIPEGDLVDIWISWTNKDKKTVRHRAENLIFNQVDKKTMKHTHWVFAGSQVIDGRFMAQVEHSIASTYHDPFAILDHLLSTGGDDTVYFVNKTVVPPKGTPVTFVIKSIKK